MAEQQNPLTVDDAVKAMKIANAEGRTEDARRIAQSLQKFQQKAPQQEEQQSFSAGERAVGVGETALALGSSIVLEPIAGVQGLFEGVAAAVRGDDDINEAAVNRINEIRQMGFQPRTEAGQQTLETVSAPFEAIHEFAQGRGQAAQEATSGLPGDASTAIGTAVQTGIEMAPSALGFRGTRGRARQRREGIEQVERQADELGFRFNEPVEAQRGRLEQAAERQRGGLEQKGDPMPEIQAAVQRAREAKKAQVDALYADARNTQAAIPAEQVRQFRPMVDEALKSFDVDDMPIVKRRLSEIADIESQLPEGSAVKLDAIEQWRQRLNKNQAAATDRAQNAALGIIKGQLDNFLESTFNADMIKGSPLAIQKWREARKANQQLRETFSENKVINQLAEQSATPEEIRSWIFGASQTGFKKEAGDVVARLKGIIGEDSPNMTALRQDALLNVMDPLLRAEEPNWRAFIRNHDKFVRNNPTVVKELFPDSRESLQALRNFAEAVENRAVRGEKMRTFDWRRAGAVGLFGHGIAKAGLKVRVARDALGLMAGKPTTAKRQIMADVLGYDPLAPILPKSPVVLGATQAAQREQEQETQ